ncbi:hypothetical protein F2Q69_00053870 [Brassica cretica]|uniref:Uncharacterized protein n=1 Tax=Brassica cretica TaxID=69181 RepID=A0A8S9N355_BRACR|nr:hypothetical protein F2Q69_00053870 [Brassica cretica]
MDNERHVTNAFTMAGMNVGPSGVVYVPITDISPIDCGKLAETYRHLKANFDKRKFPLGHKMGTTGATHQPGRCATHQPGCCEEDSS